MLNVSKFLRRFSKDDRGSIAVETVVIIPVMFWAYLTMFSIFDAYRQHAVQQKVAYAIGDIISRETTPVDDAYLNGMVELVRFMSTIKNPGDISLRVTSVRWNGINNVYERDWSQAKGWVSAMTDAQVAGLQPNLPVMPHNERVMVVETFVKFEPVFDVGLQDRTIQNFVFTRPRYAPRVLWQEPTEGA